MSGSERWTRCAVVGAGLLAFSVAVGAYPIPPRTLWSVTEEAELVIVARVEAEGELSTEADPDSWTPARARLRIVEALKGEATGAIEVAYHPGLICPAPARFVAGRTVVAFLVWDPEEDAWTVPQLSYGTLYPRTSDLPLFRRLISRAVALQSAARGEIRPPVDWLVEAAEHRATRWHGLYELASGFDAVHSFYDRGTGREDLRPLLDSAHRTRIARGFVADPSADHTFVQTLGILEGHEDTELDRTAIGLIEWAVRQEEAPYWLSDALELTLRRLGDARAEERLRALGESSWDRSEAGLREAWKTAKIELGLPEAEPLEVPEESGDEEVLGVGATTPP
jgi:hypothetical protein